MMKLALFCVILGVVDADAAAAEFPPVKRALLDWHFRGHDILNELPYSPPKVVANDDGGCVDKVTFSKRRRGDFVERNGSEIGWMEYVSHKHLTQDAAASKKIAEETGISVEAGNANWIHDNPSAVLRVNGKSVADLSDLDRLVQDGVLATGVDEHGEYYENIEMEVFTTSKILQFTHTHGPDLDLILQLAAEGTGKPQIEFWLELGSFIGGSAVAAAQALERNGHFNATVVCVDTWLETTFFGFLAPCIRDMLSTPYGTSHTLHQFARNVNEAGFGASTVAWPAPSINAMQYLQTATKYKYLPHPEVIYLDSAHLKGEVLAEMELA